MDRAMSSRSVERDARTLVPLVRLSDIVMDYPRPNGPPLRVVDSISLTVDSGQLVCLAGRSGSGKTTVLMIAAGLLRATAGSVHWGAVAITGLHADALTTERGRSIGIVFQNAALIGTLPRPGERGPARHGD